jgi:alkylation response protein AidB-like acyl-CoA dehydrogenase
MALARPLLWRLAMPNTAHSVGSPSAAAPFGAHVYSLLIPRWAAREREADARGACSVPAETVAEVRVSGLLAAPLPRSEGGADADLFACAELVRRVAAEAPATALCLAMPLGNAGNLRLPDEAVPPEQRAQLRAGRAFIAEQVLAGRILAVANSEPGAHGSLERTSTEARLADDGGVLLTGDKSFATWGDAADFFLCAARTHEGKLDAFFVARDAPGVNVCTSWDALGLQTSASVAIQLRAARASHRFLHAGAIQGTSARHWSTVLLGAVFLGVGEGALRALGSELDSGYARAVVAERALALEAAWGFIEAVARADHAPAGPAYRERCQRAKTFAARAAVDAATSALTLAGGRAYRPSHTLARYLHAALAAPLVRPPLATAMDAIAASPELRG